MPDPFKDDLDMMSLSLSSESVPTDLATRLYLRLIRAEDALRRISGDAMGWETTEEIRAFTKSVLADSLGKF